MAILSAYTFAHISCMPWHPQSLPWFMHTTAVVWIVLRLRRPGKLVPGQSKKKFIRNITNFTKFHLKLNIAEQARYTQASNAKQAVGSRLMHGTDSWLTDWTTDTNQAKEACSAHTARRMDDDGGERGYRYLAYGRRVGESKGNKFWIWKEIKDRERCFGSALPCLFFAITCLSVPPTPKNMLSSGPRKIPAIRRLGICIIRTTTKRFFYPQPDRYTVPCFSWKFYRYHHLHSVGKKNLKIKYS